jgi:hypothetical protein
MTIRVLLVLLAGCSGASTPPAEASPVENAPADGEGDGAAGELRLLDAGSEPHEALRYRFPAQDAARLRITVGLVIETEMTGAEPGRGGAPAIATVFQIGPAEPLGDGRMRFPIHVHIPPAIAQEIEPQDRAVWEPLLAGLGQLRGDFVVDDRGRGEGTLDEPPIDPRAGQILSAYVSALRGLTVPLPDEPVGAGARWSQTRPLPNRGTTGTQTTTYTLVERTAGEDGAIIDVTLEQAAGRQPLPPDGPQGTLVSLESRGASRRQLSFTGIESRFEMEVEARTEAVLEQDGRTVDAVQRTHIAILGEPHVVER